MYYGEEIGMTNVPVTPAEVQDPAEKNQQGLGLGRDPERSPMPWDSSPQAGFTTTKPWLRLGADHETVNVSKLGQERNSIFNLYRTLIRLRRTNEALISGRIQEVAEDGSVLRYERENHQQHFLILLNLGHVQQDVYVAEGRIVITTFLDREDQLVAGKITLRPSEGMIVKLR
jgi:alpha-glucosidase